MDFRGKKEKLMFTFFKIRKFRHRPFNVFEKKITPEMHSFFCSVIARDIGALFAKNDGGMFEELDGSDSVMVRYPEEPFE